MTKILRTAPAVIVAVELALLLVAGAATVARFRVFAPIDERAHYAYVQEVAEHGRLPVLGRDLVSWQALAIDNGTYPRRTAADNAATQGLKGQSYEAFQPPLYYLAAAPVFLVPNSYRAKLFALRWFDLALVLVAAGLAALLARAVFGERWLVPYSLALGVLAWPGVLVRAITVSNAALELPLAFAYLLAVFNAQTRRSAHWLVVAGPLLGLCLLTRVTLVFLAPLLLVPVLSLLRERRAAAVAAVAAPVVLLAPWLVSNVNRYHALTAAGLAKRIQAPLLDPGLPNYGLGDVPSRVNRLLWSMLPQEWLPEYGRPLLGIVLKALPLAFAALAIVAAVRARIWRDRAALLLAAPLPLALVLLVWILAGENWQSSFLIRYASAAFVPFALFAALAWRRARWRETGLIAFSAVAAVVVAVSWLVLAGSYYFTNLGGSLGIHPYG